MAVANRVQIGAVRESVAGTTPTTPRMRTVRLTGESLSFTPNYINSDELRSDRMLPAPIKVMQESSGGLNFELSYPDDNSPLSEFFRSGFFATWTNSNFRDNDGTADSVITGITTAGTVATVTTGTAFVVGQLVRFTGFGVVGNNGVFRVTTGSATVPAFVGSGITDEPVPPAAARMKVVGFAGVSGDITATATGLGSTTLDFTTLGLAVGQWIKIDSTTAAFGFATAALNVWMRITAITATALTLDNRPSGWTTDAGAGKTIRVYTGDQIKNGTTATSLSIEKGFLDQTTPTYIVNTGMQVNTLSLAINSKQKITGAIAFMGMGGSEGTVVLDASYDAATTGAVVAANANVGQLNEAGAQLTSPNWASQLDFQINNNLRTVDAVDSVSPVLVNPGECTVTGTITTYFGSDVILAKLYAGTLTSFNCRVQKNSQAMIFAFPSVTLTTGVPAASAKNTDVVLSSAFSATIDATTNAQILCDRLEFYA